MRQVSLDHLTAATLDPVELMQLAAEIGCQAVCLRLSSSPFAEGKKYDVAADPSLQAAIRREATALGVFVGPVEPFNVRDETKLEEMIPNLDAAAAIGARACNIVCYDENVARREDLIGAFADQAARRGLRTQLEIFRLCAMNSLEKSLKTIAAIGRADVGLNVDSLHLTRTGATMAQLAAVPPALILHAQINDGPKVMPEDQQWDEATKERKMPGEGEFDLLNFVRAIPNHALIGVEVPSRTLAAQGIDIRERSRRAVAATRKVIEQALGHA